MRLLMLFSLIGLALMAAIGVNAIPEIRVVSSSASGDHLKTLPSIPLKHSVSPSSSRLIIDPKKTYQKIQGFGGAITEAAMSVLSQLSSDKQEEILEAYYGESGHRYSMARVHMNSCDFSLQSYSFDELKDDFELEYFDNNVMHDQWNGMIPFAKKALNKTAQRGDQLNFFFSPWSPPAWMKGNGQMTGSSQPCLKAGDQYKQAWANYYVKFMQAYAKHGINFWGLTVQNEPEYAAPWEACTYTAEEERDFVRDYLGPALFNYNPNIKLMIHDHNKDHVAIFAQTILSDPKAAQYIWGSAVHWYSGDEFSNLELTHRLFPEKEIYASEACICPPAADYNDWSRAEKYAHDIIGDLNNYVVGWTDWNILLDSRGSPNHLNNYCDAPIRVETATQTIHYQPIYYALGHFSRFLRPGAIRIAHSWIHTAQDSGLELVVFFVPDTKTPAIATSGRRSPKGTAHASSSFSSLSSSSTGGHAVITVMNTHDYPISWVLQLSEYSAEITSPAHSLQSLFIDAEFL